MTIQITSHIQTGDIVAFPKQYRVCDMYKLGQISKIVEVPTPSGPRYDVFANWTLWEYPTLPQFKHQFDGMEKSKNEVSIRVYPDELIKLRLRKSDQEDFIREQIALGKY